MLKNGTGTRKGHAVNPIVESRLDVGGFEHLQAGQSESSHNQFKQNPQLKSKRMLTYRDETVGNLIHILLDRTFWTEATKEANVNHMQIRAM